MVEYMPYIWIGAAVVFAVLEASTSQLVSIWFVAGSVAAAVATIFTDNALIQVAVFLVVTIVALAVTRPLSKKLMKTKAVKTNAESLIGKTGIVKIDIDNNKSQGQITVNGQIWSAKAADDDSVIEKEKKVIVKSISGVKLVVEQAPVTEDKLC